MKLTTHLNPVLRLRPSGAIHVFRLDVFVGGGGTTTLWCVICEFHISVLFIYLAEILTHIHLCVYVCIFFFLRNSAICMMVSE